MILKSYFFKKQLIIYNYSRINRFFLFIRLKKFLEILEDEELYRAVN